MFSTHSRVILIYNTSQPNCFPHFHSWAIQLPAADKTFSFFQLTETFFIGSPSVDLIYVTCYLTHFWGWAKLFWHSFRHQDQPNWWILAENMWALAITPFHSIFASTDFKHEKIARILYYFTFISRSMTLPTPPSWYCSDQDRTGFL